MRVVSLNIRTAWGLDGRHAWPFRRRALVGYLSALAGDVLCLQEVLWCQRRYLRRRVAGSWDVRGDARGRSPLGERCSVFARRGRIEVVDASTLWFGPHPERRGTRLGGARHPRVATIARARDAETGRSFGVANLHLDAAVGAHRAASVAQLVGWLDQGLPWLVAGDFNAGPESGVLKPLVDAGFHDVVGPDAPGTFPGFSGRNDGPRIDSVLVSPDWRIERAWIPEDAPAVSDHRPVVVDLAWS